MGLGMIRACISRLLSRATGKDESQKVKRSKDLDLIVEVVTKARKSVPWPERITLPDGSIQCSGLTDAEISEHIARVLVAELAQMALPDELVQGAARQIFETEADMLGVPVDEAHFKTAVSAYRSAAMTGFRAILRQFLKR